jgi:hypothetical protein
MYTITWGHCLERGVPSTLHFAAKLRSLCLSLCNLSPDPDYFSVLGRRGFNLCNVAFSQRRSTSISGALHADI